MTSAGFRLIDHTADMAFEVWAADFAGLLEEATRALGEVLRAREPDEVLAGRPFRVEGADREDLLVAWLGEGVVLLETEAWLVREATVENAGDTAVDGVLHGRPLEEGEDPDRVVKAVTYHDLQVHEGGAGRPWRAQVVLDL